MTAGPSNVAPVSSDELWRIFDQVKNWGRWGGDDEAGALNLLTPARVRDAAALVQDGCTVSLAADFPVQIAPDNLYPAHHMMVMAGDARKDHGVPGLETALDYIGINYHGMACSHIDALCHVFVDGRMYNDRDALDVKSTGARHNDIMVARDGIVGRGVLLDVPALRGVEWPLTERDVPMGSSLTLSNRVAGSEGLRVGLGRGNAVLLARPHFGTL